MGHTQHWPGSEGLGEARPFVQIYLMSPLKLNPEML